MGEIPGYNPEEKKRKTVIEDSVIEKSKIPGNIEIKGKVVIDGKKVKENSPEAENARELLDQWKKVKERNFNDKTESSFREVKIPTVEELMDKGIDKKNAERMVREQLESEQDFQEAMRGIETFRKFKKAKAETSEGRPCAKCGAPTGLSDKFCSTCGAKLESKFENEKPKNCPKCGSESPSSAKFCGSCGNKL